MRSASFPGIEGFCMFLLVFDCFWPFKFCQFDVTLDTSVQRYYPQLRDHSSTERCQRDNSWKEMVAFVTEWIRSAFDVYVVRKSALKPIPKPHWRSFVDRSITVQVSQIFSNTVCFRYSTLHFYKNSAPSQHICWSSPSEVSGDSRHQCKKLLHDALPLRGIATALLQYTIYTHQAFTRTTCK
jgi:hypothetical protein